MSKNRWAGSKEKKSTKVYDAPVQSGFLYDISIEGLGSSGEGVGRVDGFTVFVPYALPGETVSVMIETVKKNYAKGHMESLIIPSSHRVKPECPVYGVCGGCRLQHVDYTEQLALKTQMVRDVVSRIGKCDPDIVKPALGPSTPWNYRNKMQVPVGGTAGRMQMGFYATESHEIVHCLDCAIQKQENNEILRAAYEIAVELGTTPYDERSEEGVLRHIIGRVGKTGETMVILVTAKQELPQAEKWVEELRKRLPYVVSIVQNYNPQRTNVIMGRKNTLLWGKERIDDVIGDLQFSLSAHSFFQVNPEQTEVLYGKALEYAGLQGNETVIDAYCGTGTISLFLAKKAKEVIGIEIVEPAVEDARENAIRNGFENARFIAGDAAEVMPGLYEAGARPEVIVFDPIRAGCKPEVLKAAAAMAPEKMVYVSCNPASMARDLTVLREYGYEAVEVQPVDMFPMTSHVETVVLMSKK